MRRAWMMIGLTVVAVAGCAPIEPARAHSIVYDEGPVYDVPSEPPPERVETIPPPPGDTWAWIPGHWIWDKGEWRWKDGRYVARPAPRAVWVPTHWVHRSWGWVLVRGHWL